MSVKKHIEMWYDFAFVQSNYNFGDNVVVKTPTNVAVSLCWDQ